MCLETEAIRAMFRRSSATVPTASASAVNCVWTVASGVELGAAAYEVVEAFHDSVRMLIGGFALSAEDHALVFEVEGWLSCSFRGSFPVRKGGAVTAEAE